ncbi:MAG: chromosomal replication initiator protein DnaA [Desulfarculaceae bacterium]|nr:chromosomal replication initiator protein DnaA [Desulfarculaceae bacterium]MCF8072569.1 chromosomal replication initiator protein DnaA [Desulfarculaceae bacterium]MCF8103472.1 chromosomal replication initiator protein DnaA [Desulfarculaceae bacterium]MCF8117510.1 chromosomal replication initiator protein DnaA [Desulfarculaceae bacterium]
MWQETLAALGGELDPREASLWLEPLKPQALSNGRLVVSGPNQLHCNTVRERFAVRLERALQDKQPGLRLSLEAAPSAKPTAGPAPGPRQMELPRLGWAQPRLNQRYVFDNFLSGGGNEFACAAAKALAGGSGLYSNSLFLMSSTGLGKSHLTQAVGHQVLGFRPDSRVAYLTAEDFTNQMTAAIRGKKTQQFKERFRTSCDLFLLEEVQFLAGKEKTQEELVYTLDALADQGKRVVFTGRMLPSQVKGLSAALASRLADSVAVGIEPPDFATRVRILERQAAQEGVQVPKPVLEFLAQEVPGDIRRMRSALVGILARGSLAGRPLDLKLAAEVMGSISANLARHTPEHIRDLVASVYGMTPAVLTGKSRKKSVVTPRNMAMCLSRRHTDASYKSIGQVFNRDHATVMYGVDQIERRLGSEPKLAAELSFLEQRLGVSS